MKPYHLPQEGYVWKSRGRKTSEADADATIGELQSLGIQLDHAEWKISRQAGVFRSKYALSYADAFAASLALQKNAHLLTGDREFKQVGNEVDVL